MIAKLRTIILSRFRQPRENEWVKQRRVTCLECESNSLNTKSLSKVQFFLTALSSFLSFVTFRAKDEGSYGQCTVCGCDCFFKSAEDSEICPKGKWDNIKIKINIREERNGDIKNNR